MKRKTKIEIGLGVILSVLLVFVLFVSLGAFNSVSADSDVNIDPNNDYFYLKMFDDAFARIRDQYVDKDKATAQKLIHGAIKGMLEALDDPHTAFLPPKVYKELMVDTKGKFGGLGIYIDIIDKKLTVVAPIEDTPAYRAGLKSGDWIYEINGKSTKGITIYEAVSKLRGKPGTKVTLTIVREGEPKPFKVTLKRAVIKVPTVKYGLIKEWKKAKYGYIRIVEFSESTTDSLRKALKKLLSKGIDGLVVDLRGNPGGLLSVAGELVDMFVDSGIIVYTKGRLPFQNQQIVAHRENTICRDTPMVVLINGASASASEIFAGAIQDKRRGIIVGVKSFGKGSVQNIYKFPDGSGMRYTIAKYYLPSGRCIHGVGIEPDIEVKEREVSPYMKTQLMKLRAGNFVKKFLKEHKDYTAEDIKDFAWRLSTLYGINLPLWLIRKEVKNTAELKKGPSLYDLDFDVQLVRALQVLDEYDLIKKRFLKSQKSKR